MKRIIFLVVMVLGSFNSSSVFAENYFSFGAGATIEGRMDHYNNNRCIGCIVIDDTVLYGSALETTENFAFGIKFGSFPTNGMLGIELEYYYRNLDIEFQPWFVHGSEASQLAPAPLPFNGFVQMNLDPINTFAFSIMLRPPRHMLDDMLAGVVEPYVGIGGTINQTQIGPARTFDALGNLVGTNVKNHSVLGFGYVFTLGAKLKLSDRVKLYGEYKYSNAWFSSDEFDTSAFGGVDTDFQISDETILIGLSFTFGRVASTEPSL